MLLNIRKNNIISNMNKEKDDRIVGRIL